MKKYSVIGNKKKVTMEHNVTGLKIVGNHCIVRVNINQGAIEVIGNDCRVEVTNNYGSINLVGSNGNVLVSKRWSGDHIQMVGPFCSLLVDGKDDTEKPYEAQMSPFSKELDDVIESIFTFVMR